VYKRQALSEHPDNDDLKAAVVIEVNAKKIIAIRQNSEKIELTGDGLKPAQSALSDKAPANIKIRRGALIRVIKTAKNTWEIAQLPEVESAFVALDPRDGAIKALVGGFDFDKNKFNHATQAWRQPGSSFKPFVYSASLEKGLSPATVINDAPLFFDASVTGGQPWEPKNFDGKFDGPMTMRTGLAKSKNMISIRILKEVGTQNTQDWVTKFGFDPERHPPYLTMALGAGSTTPMQMATAYSVFANGGYRVNPYLISKITDYKGAVIVQTKPPVLDESMRVIDARNAFVMNSLLQEVTTAGTAAKAKAALGRSDIYGKTGTTNDAIDAWFAGFHPTLTAVVWMGYDNPKPLGSSSAETGGGLSLPIWINFMQQALQGVPVVTLTPPDGLTKASGDWVYTEFASAGVRSLGLGDSWGLQKKEQDELLNLSPGDAKPASAEEKNTILNMFKN
jgi:penicillin-binding protein 1A